MGAAWEEEKPFLLAVGVPHTGLVTARWAFRFRQLDLPPGTGMLFCKTPAIDVARDIIVRDALAHDPQPSHLLFLDSDVIPPINGVMELLKYNLTIVSGIYYARKQGQRKLPCACIMKEFDDEKSLVHIAPENEGLLEVDAVGMGFILIKTDIFKKLKPPWFLWTKDRYRDGAPIPKEETLSEDFYFCKRVREELGEMIYLDMNIKCSHIVAMEISGEDGSIDLIRV